MIIVLLIVVITIATILIVNATTKNKEWKMTCNHCETVWYVNKKAYLNQTNAAKQVNDLMACPNCKSKNAKKEAVK